MQSLNHSLVNNSVASTLFNIHPTLRLRNNASCVKLQRTVPFQESEPFLMMTNGVFRTSMDTNRADPRGSDSRGGVGPSCIPVHHWAVVGSSGTCVTISGCRVLLKALQNIQGTKRCAHNHAFPADVECIVMDISGHCIGIHP